MYNVYKVIGSLVLDYIRLHMIKYSISPYEDYAIYIFTEQYFFINNY